MIANALLYYLIFINVVTFLVYGIDKWKAKQGSWRISEATLLILAVFGGSIGALLGMKVWHHKTMHKKFKYGLPLILLALLGNIIWLIFGGLHTAIEYFIAGLVLMITIIGIPFGLQSMKLGVLAIWPFGSKVKWKESQPGCLSMFMNVLWFFVGGIWICLTHIFYGLLLCITIIGIPWGKMHFRLAKLALSPFGMEVV